MATYELIETITLGSDAASVTFSDIPQTYTDLKMVASQRNTSTNAGMGIRFNNDTGGNYTYRVLYGTGSAVSSFTQSVAAGYNTYLFAYTVPAVYTANTFGNTSIYIPNYSGSTNKSCSIESVSENNASASYICAVAGLWSNASAISSISIITDPGGAAGNNLAGSSFSLYGIKKA